MTPSTAFGERSGMVRVGPLSSTSPVRTARPTPVLAVVRRSSRPTTSRSSVCASGSAWRTWTACTAVESLPVDTPRSAATGSVTASTSEDARAGTTRSASTSRTSRGCRLAARRAPAEDSTARRSLARSMASWVMVRSLTSRKKRTRPRPGPSGQTCTSKCASSGSEKPSTTAGSPVRIACRYVDSNVLPIVWGNASHRFLPSSSYRVLR